MRVDEVGEFELIERLVEALGPQPEVVGLGTRVALGVGDDCAAVRPSPGTISLHTTDTMVSGVHFVPEMPSEALGWKSLASNVSDIASMGGLPTLALVTLAMPAETDRDWLLGWYRGMASCAREYGVAIVGGDIVRAPADFSVTVALAGEVEPERMVTRSGARPGDRIIVTGSPGESALGLALYLAGMDVPQSLYDAHLHPMPRVQEARRAVEAGGVHAIMDLSDGLAGDLRHLCRASGVGAVVEESALPLSEDLVRAATELQRSATSLAVSGGEDYELLLSVSPGSVDRVLAAIAAVGAARGAVIGKLLPAGEGIHLRTTAGHLEPLGTSFTHF